MIQAGCVYCTIRQSLVDADLDILSTLHCYLYGWCLETPVFEA